MKGVFHLALNIINAEQLYSNEPNAITSIIIGKHYTKCNVAQIVIL